jgi:hypothetical protein
MSGLIKAKEKKNLFYLNSGGKSFILKKRAPLVNQIKP